MTGTSFFYLKHCVKLALVGSLFCACSSNQTSQRDQPSWISQSTRVVDNGYIVYVGSGEEVSAIEAELAAEGMALSDLANECSFIPKGTRVEDRYSEKQKNTFKSYAKVAVEIQTCDEASRTTDPAQIKLLANVSFTEQLKKFEDSIQDNRDEVADSGISSQDLAAPATDHTVIVDHVHFYVARQYVVYQNQAVILSPATAYAPGSPEYVTYVKNVSPVIGHVQRYTVANPEIKSNPPPWSAMSSRVRSERPQAFTSPHRMMRPIQNHIPQNPTGHGNRNPHPGGQRHPGPSKARKGRHKGQDEANPNEF